MAITQLIDYKVRPPKGAEKFFYRTITTVFVVVLVSVLLMLPLFVALNDSPNESSFIPYNLLDKIGMKQAGGVLIGAIILVFIGSLVKAFRPGRRSKAEGRRGYLAPVIILLGVLSFAISFVVIVLKGMDGGLDWIAANEWINSFAQGVSRYILWYYIFLGIVFGSSWAVWFVLVRHRERKEGVNRLQGNFFRKAWQFTIGDAMATRDCPIRNDLCMERMMYRYGLFLRTMLICLFPTLLHVAVVVSTS